MQQPEHDWLTATGIQGDVGSVAHIRPQHIDLYKVDAESSPVVIRDWQHLGAIIRIELFNPLLSNHSTLHAEMPSERFKALELAKGDHVNVKISHANWF